MRSGVRVADVRSQAHVIEITDGSSGRRTVVGVHLVVGAFGGGRHWVLKLRHDMCTKECIHIYALVFLHASLFVCVCVELG